MAAVGSAAMAPASAEAAPPRGSLIAFEGLDRSGKSTQCARLVDHLRAQGESVELLRFPDRRTATGRLIDAYLAGASQLDDRAVHLLFSANRWEAAGDMQRLLRAGTTVVLDRYYYSGCVYSAAKQRPGMDLTWCRQPDVGLPRPDVCLVLELSVDEAAARGGFGAERYEAREMQRRVRRLFDEMKTRPEEAADMVSIDASRDVDDVERTIRATLAARLGGAHGRPRDLRLIEA